MEDAWRERKREMERWIDGWTEAGKGEGGKGCFVLSGWRLYIARNGQGDERRDRKRDLEYSVEEGKEWSKET